MFTERHPTHEILPLQHERSTPLPLPFMPPTSCHPLGPTLFWKAGRVNETCLARGGCLHSFRFLTVAHSYQAPAQTSTIPRFLPVKTREIACSVTEGSRWIRHGPNNR